MKNRLQQIYDEHKDRADMLRDEKIQEIDEAYANYTLKQSHSKEEQMDYRKGFRLDQDLD